MRRTDLLRSPAFLLGLLVLLANDFIFKSQFHNAFTGKLSDIAGLFIFPLFIVVLLRSPSKWIFFGVAVFFIYWKSPLSENLLNGLSFISGLQFERVVDYSDLLCLPVLFLSYAYLKSDHRQVQVSRSLIMIVSAFAFMATSPRKIPVVAQREIHSLTSGYDYNEVALQKKHVISISRFESVFISQDTMFQALYCEGDTIIAYLGKYPFDSHPYTGHWPAFFVLKNMKNGNLGLVRLFVPGDTIADEQLWFNRLDMEISRRLLQSQRKREQEEKIQMWINRAKVKDRIGMKMLDSLIAHCSPDRISNLQVYEHKADYLMRNYKSAYKTEILKLFDRQDSLDKVYNRSGYSVRRYSKRLDFMDFVRNDSIKNAALQKKKSHRQ